MFSYAPQESDQSGRIIAQGMMGAAQTNAQMYNQLGNNIGGALASLGDMYGKYKNKKDMLAGMDKAVMGMSDLGAITPDFRDKYLSADNATRPFLFQALASPMFQSFTAGRSAAAQAQAWDQYKSKWGADAGGQPGAFTY